MRGRLTSEELDQRVSKAVDNFMAGYGCCQAVVAAFADLYGLDDTMAKRIGAGDVWRRVGHRDPGGTGLRPDGRQRPRREVGLL